MTLVVVNTFTSFLLTLHLWVQQPRQLAEGGFDLWAGAPLLDLQSLVVVTLRQIEYA